jgi:hypothetical protein
MLVEILFLNNLVQMLNALRLVLDGAEPLNLLVGQ